MKKIILAFLFAHPFISFSQESNLFLPKNVQPSYANLFRTKTGLPGKNYWQNSASYNISVEVIPNEKKIIADLHATYTNNSPDSLDKIVIRLYQDIFKKGNTRLRPVLPEDVNEGINISKIKISDKDVLEKNIKRQGTILELKLEKPMPPNSTLQLFFSWDFLIPKTNLRMGQYDSTSFFIGYWYPQIAVYDDIDGWDILYDTGAHEFYNEFANYRVNVTVTEDFMVWGTGEFTNPEEVFSKKYYDLYQIASKSDTVVHFINNRNISESNLTKKGKNVWKFTANNLNDFAFALSDHYLWDIANSKMKNGKNNTMINIAYNKESKDFYLLGDLLIKYFLFLDELFPKASFPFSKFTVFNGYKDRGMEFPMMSNSGSFSFPFMSNWVNTHEVAHSYFPMYVGTNEKKYDWIDEGFASILTVDFLKKENLDYLTQMSTGQYEKFAGSEWDCPLIYPSYLKSGESLTIPSYFKSFVAFNILRELMGDAKFFSSLESFIMNWKGKHPIPYDLFFFFENQYGETLDWFWNPWFFEAGYPDLKIDSVALNNGFINIQIKRVGNIPVPINITVKYKDGSVDRYSSKVDAWKKGEKNVAITFKTKSDIAIETVELNPNPIPDINRVDNIYRIK